MLSTTKTGTMHLGNPSLWVGGASVGYRPSARAILLLAPEGGWHGAGLFVHSPGLRVRDFAHIQGLQIQDLGRWIRSHFARGWRPSFHLGLGNSRRHERGRRIDYLGLRPLGVFTVIVFLWNLWLAPAALAYEAVRGRIPQAGTTVEIRPPAPDHSIWKRRDSYSIREFAALLDDIDPSSGQFTNRASAIERLLLEAAQAHRIKYVARHKTVMTDVFEQTTKKVEIPTDPSTRLAKDNAIQWARDNEMDVSKLV